MEHIKIKLHSKLLRYAGDSRYISYFYCWVRRTAVPLCRVILGHFSEGEGIHYVAMTPQSGIFYF